MDDAKIVQHEWEQVDREIWAKIADGDAQIGVSKPEQIVGKSGLQLMQAMLAGELPVPPIAKTLDFYLVEVEHGRAIFQGRPRFEHYNPLGTVHGGWFTTLLDSALGCAVHTALPSNKSYTTLELKVNMVRALNVRVPLVRAEGKVIHVGNQTATAEAKLFDASGKLYAHATTTCLVFDFPPRAKES